MTQGFLSKGTGVGEAVGLGVFEGMGVIEGVRVSVGTRVLVGGSVRVGEGKTVGKMTASVVGSGVGVEVHAARINVNNIAHIVLVKILVLENFDKTFSVIVDPLLVFPAFSIMGQERDNKCRYRPPASRLDSPNTHLN